jgi:hypothetical protein
VEVVQLTRGIQAFAPLPAIWLRHSNRIPEQSREGEAMATKFTVPHPSGGGTSQIEVEQTLEEVVDEVNEAVRIGEKFVTFTEGGKDRAFIAAAIENIRED